MEMMDPMAPSGFRLRPRTASSYHHAPGGQRMMIFALVLTSLWNDGAEPAPARVRPLVGCPTATSFDLALVNGPEPVTLEVAVRAEGESEFKEGKCTGAKALAPNAMGRLRVERPGASACEYRLRGSDAHDKIV